MGLLDIENIITPINSFEQIEELGFTQSYGARGLRGIYELKSQFACESIRFTVRYYLQNQVVNGKLYGFAIIENVSIKLTNVIFSGRNSMWNNVWSHACVQHIPIDFSISTIESLQFILSVNWFVQTFTNMLDDKKVNCGEAVKSIFRKFSHEIH